MSDDRTTLCCPHCGSTALYSAEEMIVHFPVTLTRTEEGTVRHEYDFAERERIEMDDTAEYIGMMHCTSDACRDRDDFPDSELCTVAEYIAWH